MSGQTALKFLGEHLNTLWANTNTASEAHSRRDETALCRYISVNTANLRIALSSAARR